MQLNVGAKGALAPGFGDAPPRVGAGTAWSPSSVETVRQTGELAVERSICYMVAFCSCWIQIGFREPVYSGSCLPLRVLSLQPLNRAMILAFGEEAQSTVDCEDKQWCGDAPEPFPSCHAWNWFHTHSI